MKERVLLLTLIFFFSMIVPGIIAKAGAQGDPFYKGKTIRIMVGSTAGGFYDRWGRLFGKYMSKYIPGQPEFVVQNMTGAGSVIAANHVYNVAKPDGLTLVMPLNGVYIDQFVGRKEVQFDMRKFRFIGTPVTEAIDLLYARRRSLQIHRGYHQSERAAQVRRQRHREQRFYPVQSVGGDGGSEVQHGVGLRRRHRDRSGGGKKRSSLPRPQHVRPLRPGALRYLAQEGL